MKSTAQKSLSSKARLSPEQAAALFSSFASALSLRRPAALFMSSAALSAYCFLLMPQPALAYFDLGFGTYLIQLICGFGAAIWLSFIARIRRKKKGQNSENKNQAADNLADEQQQSAVTQQEPAGESLDKSVNLAGESEE